MKLFTLRPNLIIRAINWLLFIASLVFFETPVYAAPAVTQAQAAHALAGLAVPFAENRGQTDSKVAFQARTLAGPLFVTKTGELVWSLTSPSPSKPERAKSLSKQPALAQFVGPPQPSYSVVEKFVGGTPKPAGATQSKTQVSYFHGNDRSKWQVSVPTWNQISLGEVWPGINVSLAARGKNAEKLFTVAPGADASKIAIEVKGGNLAVAKDGGLNVAVAEPVEATAISKGGSVAFDKLRQRLVTFTAPIAWQEINGERKPVTVAYRLAAANQYGFTLGTHDATQPVVIDPLIQATYLSGNNVETIFGIAVTADAVYVAGETSSSNFSGTSGGAQASGGGVQDVFVAKLSLDLKSILQSTYLGGSDDDYIQDLVVTDNAVYVAGFTNSANLPGVTGGAQATCGGGGVNCATSLDGFVAKLSLDLKSLMQSTYLGGSLNDYANALVVTSSNVYVAGSTASSDFPGTSGGAQVNYGGPGMGYYDGFVAKLALDLKSFIQNTYLGGGGSDGIFALAMTDSNVYVVGATTSPNFPGTSGGVQPQMACPASGCSVTSADAFISKLALDLKSITQSTYLGGSAGGSSGNDGSVGDDTVTDLTVTNGNVYVVGMTLSSNFPSTAGGAQTSCGGCTQLKRDLFVAQLALDLKSLTQSTYLGGSSDEGAYGDASMVVTSSNVYVAGDTMSSDFPGTTGGAQASCVSCTSSGNVYSDAVVAKLALDLKSLTQSTYLGGSNVDRPNALAVTASNVYVAGITRSSNFPGTSGGASAVFGGGTCGTSPNTYPCADGFIAKLSPDLRGTVGAPIVTTNTPSVITLNSATLKGTVNPNGAATTATFEFGTTTAYGQSITATPSAIAATAAATSVSATKTGLACNTTYHYRAKAVNSAGPAIGADQSLTTSACADFVITSAVLTPVAPVANTTFSAAVTVKNQGNLAADGGQLRLWLNQPTAQVCAATGGDKSVAVGTVAAGASKVLTITGINSGIWGTKVLRAFVDAACITGERSEANNQLVKTYRVITTAPPAADFIVTALTLNPAAPTANGNFTLNVTVKNQGTLAGNGGYLDVWNNLATVPTCGATGNAWADVGVLAAGAIKTLTLTVPAGTAGAKTARAFVDSWCEVVESNEANNQMTKAYTVQ